jgi:hypothetical protein
MASGFTCPAGDLDALFKARVTAKRADVNYKVSTVDISNRYETRTTTARANVGFQSAGVDLAMLFEKL